MPEVGVVVLFDVDDGLRGGDVFFADGDWMRGWGEVDLFEEVEGVVVHCFYFLGGILV